MFTTHLTGHHIVPFYEAYLISPLERILGPWAVMPQNDILSRIRLEHYKDSQFMAARHLLDTHLFVCLN